MSTSSFNVGLVFYYWPYYKQFNEHRHIKTEKSDWNNNDNYSGYPLKYLYVEQKYRSIKDELIASEFVNIHEYNKLINDKAQRFMKSQKVKQTTAAGGDWMRFLHYDIPEGSPLHVEHLMAVIIYCDFTELSENFSRTFRAIHPFESLFSIKKRNQNYWHLSKRLREIVQFYGDNKVETGIKGPFFCGINHVMPVSEFSMRLYSPTSTSKIIEVACRFAGDDGMVFQLNNNGDSTSSRYLRCFPCSWLSIYPEEQEYLFFGGDYRIRMESIRNEITKHNFIKFMKPLFYFDSMLNGCDFTGCDPKKDIKEDDTKLLSDLIEYRLSVHKNNDKQPEFQYDTYVYNSFDLFCIKKKYITLNLWYLEKFFPKLSSFIMNSIERNDINWHDMSSTKNLFKSTLFHLFPNLESIEIYSTCTVHGIDASYSISLLSLLSLLKSEKTKIIIRSKHGSDQNQSWLVHAYTSPLIQIYGDYAHDISMKTTRNARGLYEDCVTIKKKSDTDIDGINSPISTMSNITSTTMQPNSNSALRLRWGDHGLGSRRQHSESLNIEFYRSPSLLPRIPNKYDDYSSKALPPPPPTKQLPKKVPPVMNKAQSAHTQSLNRIRNKKRNKRILNSKLNDDENEKDEAVKQDLRNMGFTEEYIKRAYKLYRVKWVFIPCIIVFMLMDNILIIQREYPLHELILEVIATIILSLQRRDQQKAQKMGKK